MLPLTASPPSTPADGATGEKSMLAYFNPLTCFKHPSSLPLEALILLASIIDYCWEADSIHATPDLQMKT